MVDIWMCWGPGLTGKGGCSLPMCMGSWFREKVLLCSTQVPQGTRSLRQACGFGVGEEKAQPVMHCLKQRQAAVLG